MKVCPGEGITGKVRQFARTSPSRRQVRDGLRDRVNRVGNPEADSGQKHHSQCVEPWDGSNPSWELIVDDDGSTDETSAYLASVRDAAPVPVTVIADATSRGLAAATNQGLRVARGEYLVCSITTSR